MSDPGRERINKRAVSLGFPELTAQKFGFLVGEMGFLGPEFNKNSICFHSPKISIQVHFSERERYVQTFANGMVADRYLEVELSCLYVQAGLGPAQRVGWSAGTSHALRKALTSQAAALRELLPQLMGDARDELLLKCHGH